MRGFYKHPCAFLASARLVRAVMPIQGPVRPYLANSVCKHLQAPVRTIRTLCFYMGAKTTHPYTVFRRVCAWSTTSFKEPLLKTVITTKTSHNACACTRGGAVRTPWERESLHWKLGEKSLAAPGTRTRVSTVSLVLRPDALPPDLFPPTVFRAGAESAHVTIFTTPFCTSCSSAGNSCSIFVWLDAVQTADLNSCYAARH